MIFARPSRQHVALGALRRDDVVTIGKTRWRVESNRYGLNSTYVVKAGTKGKKLYVLWATDLERCCLEVREVAPGTGTPVRDQAPLSKGCFVAHADDKTWAGRRRRASPRLRLHHGERAAGAFERRPDAREQAGVPHRCGRSVPRRARHLAVRARPGCRSRPPVSAPRRADSLGRLHRTVPYAR
jgi:hypothetical protein